MMESDNDQEKPDNEASPEPAETPSDDVEQIRQQMQRIAADYQNYQKRSQRLIEQAGQLAEEKFAKELLSVLDNFEHALDKGSGTQNLDSLLKGVGIIYDHLLDILRRYGLQRIEVKAGTSFNPRLHEAMMHEVNEQYPDHSVVRELAPGYIMNDRTLRPAKVSVCKNPVPLPMQTDETTDCETESLTEMEEKEE